jgi:hypothetical protein
MRGRIPLVGGPLDGGEIPAKSGRYLWVGAKINSFVSIVGKSTVRQARGACALPTNGRALYELVDGVYVYAGHRTVYCNCCGAYHRKVEGGTETRPCAFGGNSDGA